VLTWASHGTARVVFTDSAGRYVPDTSGPVSVSFLPLSLSVVRDTIALGMRQRRSLDLGLDRTVTGAPLAVNVAVSDTTALLESPATLTMPVGSTGGPPLVLTGRDTSGVASIVVTAYRHEPAGVTVRVTRPQFGVGAPVTGIPHYPGEPPGDVTVGAGDSLDALTFSGAGAPIENVTAEIVTSNPSIASLDSTSLTVLAGHASSGTAHLSFNAPGSVTITATDPRSAYYRYGTGTSAAVVIVPKRLVFSDSVMLLGIGQFWSDAVFLEGRIPTDLVVSLSHTASAVATLDHPTDTLFSTGPSGPVALHGLAAGVDTVVATASGWIPDTLPVRVGPGTVVLWGWQRAAAGGFGPGLATGGRSGRGGPAGGRRHHVHAGAEWQHRVHQCERRHRRHHGGGQEPGHGLLLRQGRHARDGNREHHQCELPNVLELRDGDPVTVAGSNASVVEMLRARF